MSNTTMTNLPSWKKTPKLEAKGCVNEAKEVLTSIVLEAPSNQVKEMLLKIKLDASYETNSKILLSYNTKIVKETFKYLEIRIDGMTKDGAVFCIMNKLFALMPYECKECKRVITASSEAREVTCVGCGTYLCANCNTRKLCVCNLCGDVLKEKFEIPEGFFSKNFLKKHKKEYFYIFF